MPTRKMEAISEFAVAMGVVTTPHWCAPFTLRILLHYVFRFNIFVGKERIREKFLGATERN